MKPRHWNLLAWGLAGVGVILFAISQGVEPLRLAFSILGILIMLGGAFIDLAKVRCPKCQKHLSLYTPKSPGKFCPHCGEKFE